MFTVEGSLVTDINVKSTDVKFIYTSPAFTPSPFTSIVYSQGLRYRRIINEPIRLFRRLEDLKQCFLKYGFPKKIVSNILDDVVNRPRNLDYNSINKSKPNEILWVQTFGSTTDKLKVIIKDANECLKQSQAWSKDNKVLGLLSSRSRNLGDMIPKRKKLALTSDSKPPGTQRYTPLVSDNRSRQRGRPCDYCPLMSVDSFLKLSTTGNCFDLPSADCKTRNAIYCANCFLCNKKYVSKSLSKLVMIHLMMTLMKQLWLNT